MGNWHYTINGAQQGPVPLEHLQAMFAAGQLPGGTLVWNEGMPTWAPAYAVPALGVAAPQQPMQPTQPMQPMMPGMQPYPQQSLSYESPGQASVFLTARGMDMLRQTKPWVRFLSVLMLIGIGLGVIGGVVVVAESMSSRYRRFHDEDLLGGLLMVVMLGLCIIPTVFLSRYASRIADLLLRRQPNDLEQALEAQKSYWKFTGIFTLVVIGLYGVLILLLATRLWRM